MDRVIRIRDLRRTDSGAGFFLNLPDLLPHLAPDAYAWTWAIQRQPELTAEDGWDFNLPALEHGIDSDRRGLQMTFADLVRFGDRVHQVIWGEFVAAASPSRLPLASDSGPAVGASAVAGLAAIDSSFWLAGGPADVVERLVQQCDQVDELGAEDWLRADD